MYVSGTYKDKLVEWSSYTLEDDTSKAPPDVYAVVMLGYRYEEERGPEYAGPTECAHTWTNVVVPCIRGQVTLMDKLEEQIQQYGSHAYYIVDASSTKIVCLPLVPTKDEAFFEDLRTRLEELALLATMMCWERIVIPHPAQDPDNSKDLPLWDEMEPVFEECLDERFWLMRCPKKQLTRLEIPPKGDDETFHNEMPF